MKQVLNFQQLVQMNPEIKRFEENPGHFIAECFNKSCEPGLEIVYIEDSFWEFENQIEAERTLGVISDQDRKRCGLQG